MSERDWYIVASFGVFFIALTVEVVLLRQRVKRAQGKDPS